jgi:hypothetical protein
LLKLAVGVFELLRALDQLLGLLLDALFKFEIESTQLGLVKDLVALRIKSAGGLAKSL